MNPEQARQEVTGLRVEAVGALDGHAERDVPGEHDVVAFQGDDQEALDGPGSDSGSAVGLASISSSDIAPSCFFHLATGRRRLRHVPIVTEPFDGPFGSTFSFRDPDGYVITVHDGG